MKAWGIALELAAHGAAVAINHLGEPGVPRRWPRRSRPGGGTALPVQMDVAGENDVQRAFAEVRDAFEGIDLLVNNAGIEKPFGLVARRRLGRRSSSTAA